MSEGATGAAGAIRDSSESTRPRPTEQEILDMLAKPAGCGCGGGGHRAEGGACGCGGQGGCHSH